MWVNNKIEQVIFIIDKMFDERHLNFNKFLDERAEEISKFRDILKL